MFSLDPSRFLGQSIANSLGAQIIVGLPNDNSPIPQIVLGFLQEENGESSVSIATRTIPQGSIFQKVAKNPGFFDFNFIISANDFQVQNLLPVLSTSLSAISGLSNQFASFGAIVPNFSGITGDFVLSQINTLNSIMDNAQPVLLLNSYLSLQSLSQKSAWLESFWLISNIKPAHKNSEGGVIVQISLEEVLRANPQNFGKSLVTNIGNAVLGPGVGSSVASLF